MTKSKNSKTRENETEQVKSSTKNTNNKITPKEVMITLADMEKKATEVDQMEEHVLYIDENGNDVKIQFYPIFPETKITELIREAQDIVRQAFDLEVELDDTQFNEHLRFLCIKHFTHLKETISDNFEEQVTQFQSIVNSGVYEIMLKEVFSESEIIKVLDRVAEIRAQHELMLELGNTTQEKLIMLRQKQSTMMDKLIEDAVANGERMTKNQL